MQQSSSAGGSPACRGRLSNQMRHCSPRDCSSQCRRLSRRPGARPGWLSPAPSACSCSARPPLRFRTRRSSIRTMRATSPKCWPRNESRTVSSTVRGATSGRPWRTRSHVTVAERCSKCPIRPTNGSRRRSSGPGCTVHSSRSTSKRCRRNPCASPRPRPFRCCSRRAPANCGGQPSRGSTTRSCTSARPPRPSAPGTGTWVSAKRGRPRRLATLSRSPSCSRSHPRRSAGRRPARPEPERMVTPIGWCSPDPARGMHDRARGARDPRRTRVRLGRRRAARSHPAPLARVRGCDPQP